MLDDEGLHVVRPQLHDVGAGSSNIPFHISTQPLNVAVQNAQEAEYQIYDNKHTYY